MITTDLGSVTAYAEAVAQGYTGTKEEFGKLLANYTQTAEKVAEDKAAAEQAMESANESADRASTSEQNAKASEDAVLRKLAEAKTEVDASVEAGKKSKTDLNKSIADSAKAKTALDESIKSANGSKSALDKTVEQANVLDASLSSNIVDGTQLNKDITASGNKAVSDINSASAKALEDINTTGTAKLDAVNKAAEAIVADREQITKNKTDIDSLKENLSNKITKFYASNQGEAHITDSDNGKIADMLVYGKSEQKQYSGKNLFDKSTSKSAWVGDDGIYFEKGEIGTNTDIVSVYIGVKENSTYIASFKTNYNAERIYWCTYNANKEFVSIIKGANKITVPTGIRYVRVMISMEQQYCVAINDELQVELGTEATTYEPYTGGIPSPNPDYPQEIKAVVNPKVVVMAKNLLNTNNIIVGKWLYQVDGTENTNADVQYYPDYIYVGNNKKLYNYL